MPSYLSWTVPTAGEHPRLYVSDRHGPSLTAMRSRTTNPGLAAYWTELKAWATNAGTLATSLDQYFGYGKDPEMSGSLAFAYLIDPTLTATGNKAIQVGAYLAAQTTTQSQARRYQLLQLAYIYDWCYSLLSAANRTTIRNKIAALVDQIRTPAAAEHFWGASSGNIHYAAMALPAILEDDAAQAATWRGWMDSILDNLWDGVALGSSYLGAFKYFGDADGGSFKGAGSWSYTVENEKYLIHSLPILQSALGISPTNLTMAAWWKGWMEWQLWHYRCDRKLGHCQCDLNEFSHFAFWTQAHALQIASLYSDSIAQASMWLDAEIQSVNDYSFYNQYRIFDLLFRNPLRVPVQPTPATINSGKQMRVFREVRKVVMRTGWGTSDTSLSIQAARHIGGHQQMGCEAGHFELASDHEVLLCRSGHSHFNQFKTYQELGTYEGPSEPSYECTGHHFTWDKSILAANSVAIHDTNEPAENRIDSCQLGVSSSLFFGRKVGATEYLQNVGGILYPKNSSARYQPDDLPDLLASPEWNFETFAIEPREDAKICYVVLDLVRKYYAPKVSRYKRHFVWIKPGQIRASWQRPIIVIWDDMTTHSDPAGKRTQILQLNSQTSVAGSGGTFAINGFLRAGKCHVTVLQPTVERTQVAGFYDREGHLFRPTESWSLDDSMKGAYRQEINPTVPMTQPSFLTVLMPCAYSADISTAPTVSLLSLTGHVGVAFPAEGLRLAIRTGDTHAARLEVDVGEVPPALNDIRRSLGALSILGHGTPVAPVADGVISGKDRQQAAGLYRQVTALPPATNSLRRSTAGLSLFGLSVGPVPDASISGVDKQHAAGLYRGIAVSNWDPNAPPDEWPGPPPKPTGLLANPGDSLVELDWDPSPAGDLAGYSVYRRQTLPAGGYGPWSIIGSSATSFYTDATAVNGGVYQYAVSAYDLTGLESLISDPTGDVMPIVGPAAPGKPVVTAGPASVLVDWPASTEAGIFDYEVWRLDGGVWSLIGRATQSYYLDTLAVNGTPYQYKVRAVNVSSQVSPFSLESDIVTPDAAYPPLVPPPDDPEGPVVPPWGSGKSISAADTTPAPLSGASLASATDKPKKSGGSISLADTTPTGVTGESIEVAT